jgi:hypothetical protein
MAHQQKGLPSHRRQCSKVALHRIDHLGRLCRRNHRTRLARIDLRQHRAIEDDASGNIGRFACQDAFDCCNHTRIAERLTAGQGTREAAQIGDVTNKAFVSWHISLCCNT